jgi:hypothetical protein
MLGREPEMQRRELTTSNIEQELLKEMLRLCGDSCRRLKHRWQRRQPTEPETREMWRRDCVRRRRDWAGAALRWPLDRERWRTWPESSEIERKRYLS